MDLLKIKPHAVTEGTLGKHFLFYGPPSSRKTTVAANFKRPLLLATEVGYSFIPGVKAVNIKSWYEFREVVDQLKKPEVRAEYDTIVIDTVSLLSEQCVTYVTNSLGVTALGDAGWGKGWGGYKKELSSTFNLIAQLGYGIVFIAHSKDNYNEEGTLEGSKPNLDGVTMTIVNALVDFIFYLNKEKDESGQQSVFAYSGPMDSFLTKSRIGKLNPRIEFDYNNLNEGIIDAISQIKDLNIVETVEVEAEEKLTLDELKNSILKKAILAEELNLLGKAEAILVSALGGVKLNDALESHYSALQAVDLAMKDLIEGN